MVIMQYSDLVMNSNLYNLLYLSVKKRMQVTEIALGITK